MTKLPFRVVPGTFSRLPGFSLIALTSVNGGPRLDWTYCQWNIEPKVSAHCYFCRWSVCQRKFSLRNCGHTWFPLVINKSQTSNPSPKCTTNLPWTSRQPYTGRCTRHPARFGRSLIKCFEARPLGFPYNSVTTPFRPKNWYRLFGIRHKSGCGPVRSTCNLLLYPCIRLWTPRDGYHSDYKRNISTFLVKQSYTSLATMTSASRTPKTYEDIQAELVDDIKVKVSGM